ncbi:Proteasome subunit beta type-1 [Irineochytrium annulatum]|nr:Proteasome subunit beta type-1 [Irineochytrium annulatum]
MDFLSQNPMMTAQFDESLFPPFSHNDRLAAALGPGVGIETCGAGLAILAAGGMHDARPKSTAGAPVEHRFSPYTDNGGFVCYGFNEFLVSVILTFTCSTVLAIAGKDFCIVASDTRQSEGYSIHSRYAPKTHKLSQTAVLATGGMYADSMALVRRLEQRLEWYFHKHEKQMSAPALAQMLSTILYGKRFFPFYVWNVLGGLDENGEGCVFSYDPVGNFEKQKWNCAGSAGHLIQPFLDNQVGHKHQGKDESIQITQEEAIKVVKDAFTGATERDIYTGDNLEYHIITAAGVATFLHPLKKD